ncbi:MAG TPA: pectin acetylesterase-family hydrolase, partial [Thermoanaerobaculia bacterium]|nr:pectin acetylesterase-family hydrolase [Thermoanaerobaculia bacterium]
MNGKLIAAIAALVFAFSAAAGPANSCTDPYWKDTLRCVLFPNEPPQPNLGDVPVVGNGQPVPAFTRLFLTNDDVRCTDGTRPLIYVDKAVCTDANGCPGGIARGEAIESNRWIFTMTGGSSCHGQRCALFYTEPDERGFMGSSTKPAMKNMEGIHDPDPVRNPVFASYNRVRVEKCSFDRYMGRSQEVAPGGAIRATLPNGTTVSFNAWYHGFFIMRETFRTLQDGLRYVTWRRDDSLSPAKRRSCCGATGGTQLSPVIETLPPLADAEVVLLIGHSNASHGLYHNADNLAAELASIPGFHGDVRALFDENFQPGVENEAAFATTAPPNSDHYSGIWSGTSSARGETFSYDGAVYHATNEVDLEYAVHGAVHDRSCLDAHAADGTAWRCRDRLHIVSNHITTPFMIHQDFTDPNRDHLDTPNGYWVRWGNAANYSYCPDAQPCEPRFNAAEFRTRIEKQIQTLLASALTRSELARGLD